MLDLSEVLRPLAEQFATRLNWDSRCRELRWGTGGQALSAVSAQSGVAAAGVSGVGWPRQIDDPLPPRIGIRPADRLRATTKSLTSAIYNRLLRFGVTDNGSCAIWRSCSRPWSVA